MMQNTPETQKRLSQLGRGNRPKQIPKKGYSAFVRVMRLALPLAAVAIIGLLLSWPRIEKRLEPAPEKTAIPAQTVGQNELIKARFESRDEKNQPFTVTADRAVQSANDPSIVLLEKPAADITLSNGAWLAAQAEKGAYRQKAEQLLLQGNVKLFHDQGYELVTEKLLVNLKNRQAWSDQPVYAQGPAGTLQASGMKGQEDSGTLIFTGPVHLTLNRAIAGIE